MLRQRNNSHHYQKEPRMIHLHVLIQMHKIKIIDQHEAHHYGLASIKVTLD